MPVTYTHLAIHLKLTPAPHAGHLTSLSTLEEFYCKNVANADMLPHLTALPALRLLDIRGSTLGSQGLQYIGKITQLRELKLGKVTGVTDQRYVCAYTCIFAHAHKLSNTLQIIIHAPPLQKHALVVCLHTAHCAHTLTYASSLTSSHH